MGGLGELMERTTIEFPFPIRVEEIEGNLFWSLMLGFQCNINYRLVTRITSNRGTHGDLSVRRYSESIKGNISSAIVRKPASVEFQSMPEGRSSFFRGIEFTDVQGYDSVEEFESGLPTGKAKLELMGLVRKGVEEYFSQRPKPEYLLERPGAD